MNDGVVVCLGVLAAVSQHLQAKGVRLVTLSDRELTNKLAPYGTKLGEYVGNFSHEERETFRKSSRGNQGKTASRRKCEEALRASFPDFSPPGLEDFLSAQSTNTHEEAYGIIRRIELSIQEIVIDVLKEEFGDDDDEAWWYNGVKESIREKAVGLREKAKGKGVREEYLTLLEFRGIILDNWNLFRTYCVLGRRATRRRELNGWQS